MTINETVEWFEALFNVNRQAGDKEKDFYCGITNDLERRRNEHHVSVFIGTTRCNSFATAKELEEKLHDVGFDIGSQAGNGDEDSIFVYMCRKTPEFKKY